MTIGLFISEAYAQTAQAVAPAAAATGASASSSDVIMQFLPLFLIFGVFYFMLIRPQQKRFEQHKSMIETMRRGDKVVTGGGIIGTIYRIDGEEATVEIADNVRVKVGKASITQVLTKPDAATPANTDNKEKKD